MRILHTIDSAGLYGAEAVLLNLASEQESRKDQPVILSIGNLASPAKALETEATRRGLTCIPLRIRDGLNLSGAREILSIANRERIDVIHSHGYKTDILLGAVPRRRRRTAVIATLHGWTARTPWSKLGLYRFLDQLAIRRLDFVVAVNRRMLENRALRALPADRVRAIPNGIVLDAALGLHEAIVAEDTLARSLRELKSRTGVLIGAVGRLSPEKNFSALLSALSLGEAASRHISAAILGDGPEAPALRAQIERQGLGDRVLLPGYTQNARRYLHLFDLLVIPSLTEGLPMILLEALAAGLPVISTRVGDIPAALADAGALVEPGDPAALANAIGQLAATLPAYQAKAAAALPRVRNEYGAATMASRYAEVYRAALQRVA